METVAMVMSPKQRMLTTLSGQIPDRVPVCLHNFMMAIREYGISMNQYRYCARNVADVHIAAIRKYEYDCTCVDIDTCSLAEAFGAEVGILGDDPAVMVKPAISSLDEVKDLPVPDPLKDGILPIWLEATKILSDEIGQEFAIRGHTGQAPFAMACGIRGMQKFYIDIAENPDDERIVDLLDKCLELCKRFTKLQVEMGADFISLGDGSAGPDLISPNHYRKLALPYEQQITRFLENLGADLMFHMCGDTTPIFDAMHEVGNMGFEIDYKTDKVKAKEILGCDRVLFGNIDPSGVLALGTVDDVKRKVRELIEIWKPGGRFVLNAGCAIPATTPEENIFALMETVGEYGNY